MRNESHPTVVARQQFFALDAAVLASSCAGRSLGLWLDPPRPLPRQFAFFEDVDVLVVVCPPGSAASDEALAWGLVYAEDRDLTLVLPVDVVAATLQRLPWIDVPVRVFTFSGDDPTGTLVEVPIPARVEVLANVSSWGTRGRSRTPSSVIGADRQPWIVDLANWLDDHPLVDARHRDSYLAWHTAGQQILKVARTRHGLELSAGVRYSAPTDEQTAPIAPLHIEQPLTEADFTLLTATVADAVKRRLEPTDGDNEEHRLQHHLLNQFERDGALIGLKYLIREFPAWRPDRSPAYVDFLGADDHGTPHVIEVKLDNDIMLVLQALDYWIWTSANPNSMRNLFATATAMTPSIDFIVGASKTTKVIGPYMARQLEALDGEIPWRFHIASNWRAEVRIESLKPRTVPQPPQGWPQVGQQRYQRRLHAHLVADNRVLLTGEGPFYRRPTAGLLPEAIPAYEELVKRERTHKMVNHVRSSQAFALNLFAGLTDQQRVDVCKMAGLTNTIAADDVIFEYEDPADRLREATLASPHQTQVDVAIFSTQADGTRTALLIEVKLSEIAFGHCSAYEAAGNERRDICIAAGPFGSDPKNCFQLRNHDHGERRTYDQFLGPTPTIGCGCTFRLSNQPMRNVALGRTLLDARTVSHVIHALCAPRSNHTIWRRWAQSKDALANVSDVRLAELPADVLARILDPQRAAILKARYSLT